MKDINIIVKEEVNIQEDIIDSVMDIGVKITNVNYDINVIKGQGTEKMMNELEVLDDVELVNLDEPKTLI